MSTSRIELKPNEINYDNDADNAVGDVDTDAGSVKNAGSVKEKPKVKRPVSLPDALARERAERQEKRRERAQEEAERDKWRKKDRKKPCEF
jgi:hypothetical protein